MRLFFKPPCLYRELHSGHLMRLLAFESSGRSEAEVTLE
jgi:hypothetical protein